MPMRDWIQKYPQVQALLQQSDEELEYTVAESLPCEALTWARDPEDGHPLPEVPCGETPAQRGPDGRPLCVFHYARFWHCASCGAMQPQGYDRAWGPDNEWQWRHSD